MNAGGIPRDRVLMCRRQLLRILLLAATGLLYIKLRSYVAVEQLVAIYRKVENPIPFADNLQTRLLTTGYLHARYFGLLLLPLHLSADWSFSCIPLVESLADPRNAATAALYGCAIVLLLLAQPVSVLQQLLAVVQQAVLPTSTAAGPCMVTDAAAVQPDAAAGSTQPAAAVTGRVFSDRWRLLLVVGLLVGPFLPAANVFFYVGTFIGERLLYFPSIGFCLLLADLLGGLLPGPPATAGTALQQGQEDQQQQQEAQQQQQQEPQQQQQQQQDNTGTATSSDMQPASSSLSSSAAAAVVQQQQVPCSGTLRPQWLPLLKLLQLLLVGALLLGYSGRTLRRNVDWWDEERLFLAALAVCPDSAKVQQNCGVLQRRYHNYGTAMQHFRRAQQIEPGYCEPSYWMALTRINQGDVLGGLAAMKDSLTCKYTAGEALQTLNKLYLMMHHNKPDDPTPLMAWGEVLAAPSVLRVADACSTLEDAALLAVSAGKSKKFLDKVVSTCLEGIQHWDRGDAQSDVLAGLALVRFGSSLNTTLLRTCVGLRRQVYRQLTRHDLKSPAAKVALYKYISKVQSRHPGCRTLQGGGSAAVDTQDVARLPSSHQKLLHRAQAADPDDPWLQLEWGSTLIAIDPHKNLREAGLHLQVSSAIFSHIQEQLLVKQQQATSAQQAGSSSSNSVSDKPSQAGDGSKLAGGCSRVTSLDASPLTAESSRKAAMLPLERFREAAADSALPEVRALYCELLKRLCHLRLLEVLLLQQAADAAAAAAGMSGASSPRAVASMRKVVEAKAAGRRCLVELSERPGCEQQADSMRQMMNRGR